MSTGIGDLIKKRRTELNMTQNELSKKMGFETTGLISKYEKGHVVPPPDMLDLLADALEVTVGYFFGESIDNSSKEEREVLSIFRTLDKDMQIRAIGILKCLSA